MIVHYPSSSESVCKAPKRAANRLRVAVCIRPWAKWADNGQSSSSCARPENSKRLTRVLKFFRDERAQQYLKRLSLCLQLTGIATSTTGCDSGLAQDNDECPLSCLLYTSDAADE